MPESGARNLGRGRLSLRGGGRAGGLTGALLLLIALRRERGLGRSANDLAFDEHIVRAADHDEMFDIVAADEDEAAARVDREGVEHAEARLAGAARAVRKRKSAAGKAAEADKGQRYERKDNAEGNDETHGGRQFTAKNLIEHA